MALLCGGLLLSSLPASAQDDTEAAAKRIEQLRNQAGASVDAAAGVAEPGTSQVQADEAADANALDESSLPANELLPLGVGEGGMFSDGAGQSTPGTMGDGWLLSTLAALGVVLAIVFAIRWLLKRGGVVSTAVPSGSVVEVLSRTTVAPRSHVVLMRVGQRILVVSDSSAGMRTLASVHEPEEVAELLGAVDSAKPTSMSQNFGSVMKKLSGQWAEDEVGSDQAEGFDPKASTSTIDEAEGALSRVRGRLATLSEAGGGRA